MSYTLLVLNFAVFATVKKSRNLTHATLNTHIGNSNHIHTKIMLRTFNVLGKLMPYFNRENKTAPNVLAKIAKYP